MPRLTPLVRALVLVLALAFTAGALAAEHAHGDNYDNYEVWALDQGTNIIYILTPELQVAEAIALPEEIDMPHMIDFDSQFRYAFIANVASNNTAVVRTSDREVVAILPTGAMSHAAVVTPDDRAVIVDVMGHPGHEPGALVEYTLDLENEVFTAGRTLVLADDPLWAPYAAAGHPSRPICHDYTLDGRYAYVTLGPALGDGGLVVVDLASFTLARAYGPDEVRANCGTIVSPDGRHMFVNGGSVTEGVWYVFDTETHEPIHEADSRGTDAHGVWFTPDGGELWMVNRHSSNAIVIDPETFEVVGEIAFTGKSPDILAASPDGRYMFITLRGPEPRSGPHAIAGDTPGVAVFDIASRELVTILEPDQGNPKSDFHGIGVRVINP